MNACRTGTRRVMVGVDDLETIRVVSLMLFGDRTSVTVLAPGCFETATGCKRYLVDSGLFHWLME